MTGVLAVSNQVLGDNFGFVVKFPYDVTGWRIEMSLKETPAQASPDAAKVIASIPTVTPDADGYYNVQLAIDAADTADLDEASYFFDIVTTNLSGVVSHVVNPLSTVTFIKSIT